MSAGHDSSTPAERERMRREASEWIALRDAGFTAEQQDAFFAWLAADPRHAEICSELQTLFRQMDVMVEWRPLHAPEPNPDLLLTPSARRAGAKPWGWMLAAAAALVLGLWIWPAPEEPRRAASVTRVPASEPALSYERHVLEDGSVMELNRGAQVTLQFDRAQRVLQLVAGEAYFTVAKDPSRPFIVRAGGGEVTAVGTAFNVSLSNAHLEVFVTEGRIRLEPPKHERLPAAADVRTAHLLEAGQGVLVPVHGPAGALVIAPYSAERVAQKLSWKDELVEFTGTPLSDVILEFNRRNHTQLVIGDPELSGRQITGALRPSNLDGFVELLQVTQEIEAERFGTSKIVLRKKP